MWFAFLGLSGAVLVFWHALEDATYPATIARPSDAAALPLEALREKLLVARPAADIFRISLPDPPGGAMRLDFFDTRPGTDDVFRGTAFLDPATGALLAERIFGEAWIHTLYSLHSGLILGRTGIVMAALAGLVLALLPILGLLLWWHRDGRSLRESLAPVAGLSGLRRLRNWHRALGLWATIPLLLASITGAGLAFPETVRDLARPILGEPVATRHQGPVTGDLAAAMARAEELLPGFRSVWIDLPLAGTKDPTSIILRPVDGRLSGPAVAVLGPALGKQMEVTLASPVETLRAWIMGLHNGVAFGLAHRLFVVALGLAPITLAVLGWLAWRRRARQRAAAGLTPRMGARAGIAAE